MNKPVSKTELQPIGATIDVPIISCRIAPENVRAKRKSDDIQSLAANIEAYGLINALVGYQVGDAYFITAGGRRLRACEFLKLETVPVKVRARGLAIEISLSENAQRTGMHPADEAVAFAEMVKKGGEPVKIANAFGVKERYVHARVKLASLHKPIFDALATDQISIEAAEQYAMAPADRQASLFKKIGKRPYNGQVRRELLQGNVSGGSREALFVGEEAYKEAGGRIERDLFEEDEADADSIWLDKKVLDKLCAEKLELKVGAVRTEGWGFVEIGEMSWNGPYERATVAAKLKADKAKRGCLVSLGHNGDVVIIRNVVKKGQAKAIERAAAKAKGETPVPVAPMTKGAHESLTRTASKIVSYACVKNPRIALVALAASLARAQFEWDDEEVVHIASATGWHARGGHERAQPTSIDEWMEAIHNEWQAHLEPHAQDLETYLETLERNDLDKLLGFLVALQISHVELYGERETARKRLGRIGRLACAPWASWAPSAEFLKGLSAPALAEAAREVGVEPGNKRKAELAGAVAAAAVKAEWVPALFKELCVGAPPKPAPIAKPAAKRKGRKS